MFNNLIDADLPVEVEEQAVQFIRSAEALFPYLIGLTPDERKKIPKMGVRSLDFVERSVMHARENRNLLPSFITMEQFERDFRLLMGMRRVLSITEIFSTKLKDTYFVVGSELFSASREFYNAVKRAAKSGVLGSEKIRRELAVRYTKQPTKEEAIPDETQVLTKEQPLT